MALVAEYHNSRVCLTERDEAAAQQIIEAHCLDGRSGAIRLALRRQARREQLLDAAGEPADRFRGLMSRHGYAYRDVLNTLHDGIGHGSPMRHVTHKLSEADEEAEAFIRERRQLDSGNEAIRFALRVQAALDSQLEE